MVPLALLIAVVELDVRDCAGATAVEVERIVRIELGDRISTSSTTLSMRCAGKTASLAATSGDGRAVRDLPLGVVDERVRARLVALALGELLDDPALLPPVRVERPRPVPPSPSPSAPVLAQIGAKLGANVFAEPASVGFSGEVFGGYGLGVVVLRGGAGVDYATRSVALGTVRMIALSVDAGLAARVAIEPVFLEVAGGVRLGYANLSGVARNDLVAASTTIDGLFFGPNVDVGVFVPVSDALEVGLDLEAGVALQGVVGRADGAAQIGIDGLWVRTALVVAFDLSR